MDSYGEKFNFITAEEFRSSLVVDYSELLAARASHAWKSVHVLAGSIIEAILIDYLVAAGHVSEPAGLKMDLSSAIAECTKHGILSARSAELATVVKSYRNLIHPGRVIRLRERVDENSATVAHALLEMIIEDVAAKKRESYGITAEQLLSKIERDKSATGILKHLLKEVPPPEIRRLLLRLIPARYFEILADPAPPLVLSRVLRGLEETYRVAFNVASDDVKREVAENFVRIVKEEDEEIVYASESAFLVPSYLEHLSPENGNVLKQHLFHRLKTDSSKEFLNSLKGIVDHIEPSEALAFFDPVLRLVSYGRPEIRKSARDLAVHELIFSTEEMDKRVIRRIDEYLQGLADKGYNEQVADLKSIRNILDAPA